MNGKVMARTMAFLLSRFSPIVYDHMKETIYNLLAQCLERRIDDIHR